MLPLGASLGGKVVMNPPAKVEDTSDMCSTPGSGRCPGGGIGNPLQDSSLGIPMGRRFTESTVHRVTELDTIEDTHTQTHTHPFRM